MIKKIILISAIIILQLNVNAQQKKLSTKSRKAIEFYNSGHLAFRDYKFAQTIEQLSLAIEKDSNFIEAYLVRAEAYNAIEQYDNEIADYKKVEKINPAFFNYLYYNLATAYWLNGNYQSAIESMGLFLKWDKAPKYSIEKANLLINNCRQAIEIMKNPVQFIPVKLSNSINDNNDQYWPSLSVNGQTMVYTVLLPDSSRRTLYGEIAMQEDFYVSRFVNGSWQKGVPLGPPVNTPQNEGAQNLSADGNTLVFTACQKNDGFGRCDIYFAYNIEGQWTKPVNAGSRINSKFSEKQPCLSPDGQMIIFSSDRPGGFGQMDFWYSVKNAEGQWAEAKNLGKPINTEADEVSPFLHHDNTTFYFSSDGHPGLGRKDIFMSQKTDNNKWEKPKNLGYPINTHRDEIGLVIDAMATKAYYSTNYGSTSRNIFVFDLPEHLKPNPVSYVSGKIYDAITNEPLQAWFYLQKHTNTDTIMQNESDTKTGRYLVCLPANNSYAFNVQKNGYLFYSRNFSLHDVNSVSDPLILDIGLYKISEGQKVVLDNIFFGTDSFELLPESETELNNLSSFLLNNTNIIAEVGGHTDNTGTESYNTELSQKRAKAVYNYLVNKGVNPDRLTYKGYGQTQPVAGNNTEHNKALNRRTELKVIKVD